MDINLEYYKIFYYTAKQKSVTLAAVREGSWLCIVCKNGKGSTSDQGG